ncbi:FAD:protein FMN transferase [Nonomuraea sp. NPDC050536]|uniref:FAD:protein FMN transferase n=1 Tax=Nonomuraea sp. NPDC050536 TaxID=3364366 RepID=UPI0037CBA5F3
MRHAERVMGTVVSFEVRHAGPEAWEAVAEAVEWLHLVDEVFSTYRPDSVISRLAAGDQIRCPAEVSEVLDLCAQVERDTLGYFTLTPHGRLDPTGLVKGWAIERAASLLRAAGLPEHCVNGGGDLQVGAGRWRVGITHPLRPRTLAAVVTGGDLAVATSGTAERGPHIVNPHTGGPAMDLASITLVGPRLATVDAYATAAFAMGHNARAWVDELDGMEAFAITPTGDTWTTSGWATGPARISA